MGTDRKIKSDGEVHIESDQVDINSSVDVTGNVNVSGNVSTTDVDATGDVGSATVTTTGNATIGGDVDATGDIGGATSTITGNASVGGDFTVTGDTSTTDLTASGTGSFTGNLSVSSINNLTFPSADGTNGQAIITDGSGALSFGDVASGGADVDTIASASDAANYSGTARFIQITATVDITFPETELKDRIIYCSHSTAIDVIFQKDLYNCKILLRNQDFHFDSPYDMNDTTGPDSYYVENCEIKCRHIQLKPGFYSPNPGQTLVNEHAQTIFVNHTSMNADSCTIKTNSGFEPSTWPASGWGSNNDLRVMMENCSILFDDVYLYLFDAVIPNSSYNYGASLRLINTFGQIRDLRGVNSPNGGTNGTILDGFVTIVSSNITIGYFNSSYKISVNNQILPVDDTYPIWTTFTGDYPTGQAFVTASGSSQTITSNSATKYSSFNSYEASRGFQTSPINSSQRFTIPLTGMYLVSVAGRISNIGTDSVLVRIKENGNQIQRNFNYSYDNSASGVQFTLPACGLFFSYGDYIELEFDSGTDTNYDVVVDYFSIVKV